MAPSRVTEPTSLVPFYFILFFFFYLTSFSLFLTGYYRVNYDTTNWKRIAGFLNTDDYGKIALLNRAQIIKDASDMMTFKRLDVVTYLEIVNYLWREEDPVAWNPAFDVINELNTFPRVSAVFKVTRTFRSMSRPKAKLDKGQTKAESFHDFSSFLDLYRR